jgi:hypothetical protein
MNCEGNSKEMSTIQAFLEGCLSQGPYIFRRPPKYEADIYRATRVEAGANTSTVAVRVVGGWGHIAGPPCFWGM